MFADISNISNNFDLFYILASIIIVDLVVIYIARNTNYLGDQINIWYDKFGLSAVALDVLIIMIGFVITRYIFSAFNLQFSPVLFLFVILIVQVLHDVVLYQLVIRPSKPGANQIIDLYKAYADENGFKIILADSAMMLSSAVLAMYLKNKEIHETSTLLIVGLYTIPYLLFQNK
jgi:uncharacterized protein YacL